MMLNDDSCNHHHHHNKNNNATTTTTTRTNSLNRSSSSSNGSCNTKNPPSRMRNGTTTTSTTTMTIMTTTALEAPPRTTTLLPMTQINHHELRPHPTSSSSQYSNKYRRRSRRSSPLLVIQQYSTWMWMRMTYWFRSISFPLPSIQKSSSSSSSSSYSNQNTYSSSCTSSTTSKLQLLVLCLFGMILILLILIAYLVVLLIESSTTTTTTTSVMTSIERNRTVDHTTTASEHEYQQNFGHLVLQQVPDSSEKHPIIQHSLIDTMIYSKNIIHHNNNNSMATSNGIDSQGNEFIPQNKNELQIVWLMSFPNSGTSYTSRLVRDVTQTFTASNYADETPEGLRGERIPVYTNETYGPFWTIPAANANEYQYPTRYVLTKTHCGIRCSLCSPSEYAETTYSFRRRCLVTKWVERDPTTGRTMNVYSTYPVTHVGKAVHVVRNPFDNVVSRFHLEHTNPNRTAKEYTPNRHGFLRYCLSIDYKYVQQEIKYMHFQENKLLQDLWLVPCHADFMRYIEWHNLAFITTHDLNIPTYILHYDWYSTQYERVTTELLHFLQLPTVSSPPPFVPGKVYDQYYTTKEKLIVKRAFEFMATSTTWEHIQQYFPPDV